MNIRRVAVRSSVWLGRLPTVTSTRPYPHRRNSRQQESGQGIQRCFLTLTHQTVWGSASTDSYLLGSYRIATAPELNASRLTSFKSRCFDSPANNVGPWPASQGCITNSYPSINPSSANASGSFTPPTKQPLTGLPFELLNGLPQIPAHELRVPIDPVQGARHDVLPCRVDRPGEGLHPIGPRARLRRRPPRCLHHFVSHPAKEEGIRLGDVLDRVTMQVFVREHGTMIAAPVQCDVDGIPKGSHYVRVPIAFDSSP